MVEHDYIMRYRSIGINGNVKEYRPIKIADYFHEYEDKHRSVMYLCTSTG